MREIKFEIGAETAETRRQTSSIVHTDISRIYLVETHL